MREFGRSERFADRGFSAIANVGRGSRSMKFRCTFSFFLRSRSSFFQRKLKPTIASRCDERIDGVRCSFRVVKEKLRTNREKREDKGNEDRRKKKKKKRRPREEGERRGKRILLRRTYRFPRRCDNRWCLILPRRV